MLYVSRIKAIPARPESDFVLVSCAGVLKVLAAAMTIDRLQAWRSDVPWQGRQCPGRWL